MSDEIDKDKVIDNLIYTHGAALVALTLANVEQMVYTLKGTEEPQGPYTRGYRDAIDTVLIKLRNFDNLIKESKPNG